MDNISAMSEKREKAAAAKAAAAKPAASAAPAGGAPNLKATETFAMMGAFLDQGNGGDIIKKV